MHSYRYSSSTAQYFLLALAHIDVEHRKTLSDVWLYKSIFSADPTRMFENLG